MLAMYGDGGGSPESLPGCSGFELEAAGKLGGSSSSSSTSRGGQVGAAAACLLPVYRYSPSSHVTPVAIARNARRGGNLMVGGYKGSQAWPVEQ